jgi:hypothetical protein
MGWKASFSMLAHFPKQFKWQGEFLGLAQGQFGKLGREGEDRLIALNSRARKIEHWILFIWTKFP